MCKYIETLNEMTVNELYREYTNIVDSMQGMAQTINVLDRTLNLSKLTIINNVIREKVRNGN